VNDKQRLSKEDTERLKNIFFNVDELQHYIKRSKGAIRNLVLRKAIPYRKPAGRLLFLKEEIDQWIQIAPGMSLEKFKENLTLNM
jgi:hypothetical protein